MHDSKFGDPLIVTLAAFVIAQTTLNLPNVHLVPVAVTLFFLPAVLVLGGLVYFLAAIFSFVRGDTFGLAVDGFYGGFFTSIFLFLYWENSGVLKFGTAAPAALGTFLLIWTILTVPFVFAAFRVQKLFGALFLFVFLAFLGATLANLAGLNTAYGGWAALVSAAIGLYMIAEALMKTVAAEKWFGRTSSGKRLGPASKVGRTGALKAAQLGRMADHSSQEASEFMAHPDKLHPNTLLHRKSAYQTIAEEQSAQMDADSLLETLKGIIIRISFRGIGTR